MPRPQVHMLACNEAVYLDCIRGVLEQCSARAAAERRFEEVQLPSRLAI